jgi:hypothetical protein
MYTALRAASRTIVEYLQQRLEADAVLGNLFDSSLGGTLRVSPNTPQEMTDGGNVVEGLSVWLYRVVRDDQRLNAPPQRINLNQLRRTPLPLRLHYLMTPIVNAETEASAETEQLVLGKVLQTFYDHPKLRGVDLRSDFQGTGVELNVRLEPLTLEEITRVYDALDRSYQLSISYEVSVVSIHSSQEPEDVAPVEVVLPEYGVIVGRVS